MTSEASANKGKIKYQTTKKRQTQQVPVFYKHYSGIPGPNSGLNHIIPNNNQGFRLMMGSGGSSTTFGLISDLNEDGTLTKQVALINTSKLITSGSASDVCQSSDGNIILAGNMEINGPFSFLIKIDQSLSKIIWSISLQTGDGSTNFFYEPDCFACCPDGGIIVHGWLGELMPPQLLNLYQLVKFDNNGNLLWLKTFNSTSLSSQLTGGRARHLLCLRDNSIIATGTETVTSTAGAGVSLMVTKFDPLVNLLWSKTWLPDPSGSVAPYVTFEHSDGGIVIGGPVVAFGAPHAYILKLDSNGNGLFAVLFSDGIVEDATEANNGSIVSVGIAGGGYSFVVKLNSDGTYSWGSLLGIPISACTGGFTPSSIYFNQSSEVTIFSGNPGGCFGNSDTQFCAAIGPNGELPGCSYQQVYQQPSFQSVIHTVLPATVAKLIPLANLTIRNSTVFKLTQILAPTETVLCSGSVNVIPPTTVSSGTPTPGVPISSQPTSITGSFSTPSSVTTSNACSLKPSGLLILPSRLLSSAYQGINNLYDYASERLISDSSVQSSETFNQGSSYEKKVSSTHKSSSDINGQLALAAVGFHLVKKAYNWFWGSSSSIEKTTEEAKVESISRLDKVCALNKLQKKLNRVDKFLKEVGENSPFDWMKSALEDHRYSLSALSTKSSITQEELSELELDIEHFYKEFKDELATLTSSQQPIVSLHKVDGQARSIQKFGVFGFISNGTRSMIQGTSSQHLIGSTPRR